MNIRDLKYLLAVAKHRHFKRAAEACYVSQPALSMQIKKLEETLGVQLIERTNKTVFLTDIGKHILAHASEILDRIDTMIEVAKIAKDPFRGELRLGVIPTLGPYLLPYIIPRLTKQYPQLSVYLLEEQTVHLLRKLKEGTLDAALLGYPQSQDDFNSLPLFREEFLLAIPPTHALSKRKTIKHADLENNVLLLLEDGHCMRDLALEVCYQSKASEANHFRATSIETLRHMVAFNAGITLMPKLAYKSNDGICYIPFSTPKPERVIGLSFRSSSAKKILLNQIAKDIQKIMVNNKQVKI
jgi:LysR family hydrogen peroxide-inducible transcriptional activator